MALIKQDYHNLKRYFKGWSSWFLALFVSPQMGQNNKSRSIKQPINISFLTDKAPGLSIRAAIRVRVERALAAWHGRYVT